MCDKPTHPHQEVMKAWAEGKIIQARCNSKHPWMTGTPFCYLSWHTEHEYRVKPETKKYRVARLKNDSYTWTLSADNDRQAEQIEKSVFFSNWLTDWIEYDV